MIYRNGKKEDARVIASLIMTAMSEECCRYFYGEGHTSKDFHEFMSGLAEMEESQYSYKNIIVADRNDEVAGIAVSYDGGRLHELRKAFIDGVKAHFGKDCRDMHDETQEGELYLDSFAVKENHRGKGIGAELLKKTKEKAQEMGIARVGLLVDENNLKAEKLYRRKGFEFVDKKDWGGHAMKHLQSKI